MKYEWDFDGDGTFDRTSATGETLYRYDSEIIGHARVRVTDKAGRTAIAATELAMTRDGDLIPDEFDNCPDLSNPTQQDANQNWIGDSCDDPALFEPQPEPPTPSPSASASPTPSAEPSGSPSASSEPSLSPSTGPTTDPTISPSIQPTASPERLAVTQPLAHGPADPQPNGCSLPEYDPVCTYPDGRTHRRANQPGTTHPDEFHSSEFNSQRPGHVVTGSSRSRPWNTRPPQDRDGPIAPSTVRLTQAS